MTVHARGTHKIEIQIPARRRRIVQCEQKHLLRPVGFGLVPQLPYCLHGLCKRARHHTLQPSSRKHKSPPPCGSVCAAHRGVTPWPAAMWATEMRAPFSL